MWKRVMSLSISPGEGERVVTAVVCSWLMSVSIASESHCAGSNAGNCWSVPLGVSSEGVEGCFGWTVSIIAASSPTGFEGLYRPSSPLLYVRVCGPGGSGVSDIRRLLYCFAGTWAEVARTPSGISAECDGVCKYQHQGMVVV